jgi:hypothetical protein
MLARPAAGRARTRLVYEVKPFGTAFNGVGLEYTDWITTGLTGTLIEQSIAGLTFSTAYHWRARLQYFPYLNYGSWFSTGNNGAAEQDLKIGVAPTPTPTSTPTNTPTVTPTATPTTPTNTPIATPTEIPTNTPTPTVTPIGTPTPIGVQSNQSPRPRIKVSKKTVVFSIKVKTTSKNLRSRFTGYLFRAVDNSVYKKFTIKLNKNGAGKVTLKNVPVGIYWAMTVTKRSVNPKVISSALGKFEVR